MTVLFQSPLSGQGWSNGSGCSKPCLGTTSNGEPQLPWRTCSSVMKTLLNIYLFFQNKKKQTTAWLIANSINLFKMNILFIFLTKKGTVIWNCWLTRTRDYVFNTNPFIGRFSVFCPCPIAVHGCLSSWFRKSAQLFDSLQMDCHCFNFCESFTCVQSFFYCALIK